MTPATLRNRTYKDLAQMAKKRGVTGWHSMRKDQLVRALARSEKSKKSTSSGSSSTRRSRSTASKSGAKSSTSSPRTSKTSGGARGKSSTSGAGRTPAQKAAKTRLRKRISQLRAKDEKNKNLANGHSASHNGNGVAKDRLVVMVRDPYWLHAYWELTRKSVERVQAAMGQRWHGAAPMLRVFEVTNVQASTTSDRHLRSVEIHGGVNNWYIDVSDPPKSYRLDIGYQSSDGEFFSITRSNVVTTPPAASRDTIDNNWADVAENFDRIYAMSGGYSPDGDCQELRELLEERLRRPMGSPVSTRFGAGFVLDSSKNFTFDVNAELIIFGVTRPDAHVMLKGEPVQVRGDGTFTVRLNLPDCRQVIPVVASSSDGVEQRTVAIAIERNTKQMETIIHDTPVSPKE